LPQLVPDAGRRHSHEVQRWIESLKNGFFDVRERSPFLATGAIATRRRSRIHVETLLLLAAPSRYGPARRS
jgi:hypothetical protein